MSKRKNIIGICILTASFFFFLFLFLNWDDFKSGFRSGDCTERNEKQIK